MSNISDKIADDLIDRQVSTLKAAEGLSQRLVSELQAAEEKILSMLNRTDLTKFTRQRTIEALNQVRRIATSFSQKSYQVMRRESSSIAELVAGRSARDLNDLFGLDLFNPTLSANQLKRILDDRAILGGQTLADYWNRQPGHITDAYSQVLRTGLITGASKGQMVAEIKQSAKLAQIKGSIRTMVRTSVMEVANAAREDMYRQNADLVKGIQWLSTLDLRTSPICRALDGLAWTLEYVPIGHSMPYPGSTAHPNCRSTQIPLLRSFEELAGKNKKLAAKLDASMSSGTRASMDGQVASDIRYDDWLKSQDADRAREILGPTRYAAWKAGQLSLRDMVDQSDRALTVAELDAEFSVPYEFTARRWKQVREDGIKETNAFYKRQLEKVNGKFDTRTDDALVEYITGDYASMQRLLRQLGPAGAAAQDSNVAALLKAFENAPLNDKRLRSFRVVENAEHAIGDTVEVQGFWSTSTRPIFFTAADSDAPVVYDIVTPAGTSRIIPGGSLNGNELIYNDGTRFRVVGKTVETFTDAELGATFKDTTVYRIEVLPESVPVATKLEPPLRWLDEAKVTQNAVDYWEKELLRLEALSADPRLKSLKKYAGKETYKEINNYLRGDQSLKKWKKTTEDIKSLINETPLNPSEMRLWRATTAEGLSTNVGDTGVFKGFVSTAHKQSYAEYWADRMVESEQWLKQIQDSSYTPLPSVMLDIKVPKGVARILAGSDEDEFELILNHDTKFTITGKRIEKRQRKNNYVTAHGFPSTYAAEQHLIKELGLEKETYFVRESRVREFMEKWEDENPLFIDIEILEVEILP